VSTGSTGSCFLPSYVVLDDDVTACVDPARYIRTSCLLGLTDEDVEKAISILFGVKERHGPPVQM